MYQEIITLSNHLRLEGMVVSLRTTQTAAQIWNQYKDEFNVIELHDALKTVYVKSADDQQIFTRAFFKLFIQKPYENQRKIRNLDTQHIQDSITQTNEISINQDDLPDNQTLVEDRKEQLVDESILRSNSVASLDSVDTRIFDLCKKLGKKIANQRSKRRKHYNSHKVDMLHTIRKNMKYGGHMIDVVTCKPPMRKTNHIFLTDVSGSCAWISTWFFTILYGCKKTFNKVTMYNFDNRLVEVTNVFDEISCKDQYEVSAAFKKLGAMGNRNSDLTKSFKQFLDKASLNNHTDVIIMTDCRDWTGKREDGVLESAMILKQICLRSHKVIILNPEKKIRWKTATGCVNDYKAVGASVYEVNTMDKFAQVISKL